MGRVKNDLVAAAEIYWSTLSEIDPNMADNRHSINPESATIFLDTFAKLSKEGRMLAKLLTILPNEMFTSSGKVINCKLQAYTLQRFGWSVYKTESVKAELIKSFS